MKNHQPHGPTLFDTSTSEHARRVAQGKAGERYRQICSSLATGPKCIFEVAAELGCFDHQISGRFGELVELGLIYRTGMKRTKPATGCPASVYAIVGDMNSGIEADAGDTVAVDSGQGT